MFNRYRQPRPHSIPRRGPDAFRAEHTRFGWVSAGPRWLSVTVHEPTAPARGAVVVIAGSPGRERVTLHRTLVHTARELAADGWHVVRFDWSGTGLSPWHQETAPAQSWAEDLESVRQWAANVGPVHGLGVRLGGTILAAADAAGWASRHVVAPVAGKRWIRHHATLRRMSGPDLPAPDASGTELMDLHLDAEGASALKALPRPEDGPGVSIVTGPEVEELPVDVHPRIASVPPHAAAALVTALAACTESNQEPPDRTATPLEPREHVEYTVNGAAVQLRRTEVGARARPAVETSPLQPHPDAPGMAFVSLGSEPMEAPGSLWTRAALEASSRGAVCLLAERTETGELVGSDLPHDPNPYSRRTLVESRELVTHLAHLTTGPLAAVGVCLGAWALVASAQRLPREVTRRLTMYTVNNVAWHRQPWRYWRQGVRSGPLSRAVPGDEISPQEGAHDASAPSPRNLGAVGRTAVRAVRRRALAGPAILTLAAATAGVIDVPRSLMKRLSRIPGFRLNVLFGPADAAHIRCSPGPHGGSSTVVVLDPLDHSLHATASRRTLLEYLLTDFLGDRAPVDSPLHSGADRGQD